MLELIEFPLFETSEPSLKRYTGGLGPLLIINLSAYIELENIAPFWLKLGSIKCLRF